MRTQHLVVLSFTASTILFLAPRLAIGESFDRRSVKGIETFGGSAAAREILGKNGFVVADPAFKQIFEAYIKSPRACSLEPLCRLSDK